MTDVRPAIKLIISAFNNLRFISRHNFCRNKKNLTPVGYINQFYEMIGNNSLDTLIDVLY